ncbi:hypothetical protein [Chromobacterium amazonense]|uniref:hypothetical protein n=1 Tax=Chromobacterium amazonense TaxID=1382803 RepID=UPI0011B268D5|nr:hypothetical protein [Chromobacterium amazonense]
MKQMEALLDELERVGLIKRAATVHEVKKLVLKLPLLERPGDEQDMSRSVRKGEGGAANSIASKAFDAVCREDEQDMSGQPERDISVINKYIYTAREDVDAEKQGAAALLAAAADRLGVKVGGAANPAVLEWADEGVTVSQLRQAIDRSRGYIAADEAISVRYLSKVLRSIREEGKPSAGRAVRSGLRERKTAGREPAWKDVPAPAPGAVVPVMGGVVGGGEGDWLE